MELKPCPFCGGKAEERYNYGGIEKYGSFVWYKYVQCEECGAKSRAERQESEETPCTPDDYKRVDAAWNRRVKGETET